MALKRKKNQLKLDFLEFGIANISIIPVRFEPSEKSEMVTQVLFGEHFEIIRFDEKWAKIRIAYDGYEGWVDKKMIEPITKRQYHKIGEHNSFVVSEITRKIYAGKDILPMTILAGSTVPFYNGKFSFKISSKSCKFKGRPVFNPHSDIRKELMGNAFSYINTPYLWGGKSPFGIDCSGFSQVVYKINRIMLPRDASQQVMLGVAVNFVNEAKPGDLAFFDNDEGIVIHVGILTGDGQIIHSSGKVRIDKIDHNGIFNIDTKRYSHKLRVVKDIISYV